MHAPACSRPGRWTSLGEFLPELLGEDDSGGKVETKEMMVSEGMREMTGMGDIKDKQLVKSSHFNIDRTTNENKSQTKVREWKMGR